MCNMSKLFPVDNQSVFVERPWARKQEKIKIKRFSLKDLEIIRQLMQQTQKDNTDLLIVEGMLQKLIIKIALSAYPEVDDDFIDNMDVADAKDILDLVEEVNRFGWGKGAPLEKQELAKEQITSFWEDEAENCVI